MGLHCLAHWSTPRGDIRSWWTAAAGSQCRGHLGWREIDGGSKECLSPQSQIPDWALALRSRRLGIALLRLKRKAAVICILWRVQYSGTCPTLSYSFYGLTLLAAVTRGVGELILGAVDFLTSHNHLVVSLDGADPLTGNGVQPITSRSHWLRRCRVQTINHPNPPPTPLIYTHTTASTKPRPPIHWIYWAKSIISSYTSILMKCFCFFFEVFFLWESAEITVLLLTLIISWHMMIYYIH